MIVDRDGMVVAVGGSVFHTVRLRNREFFSIVEDVGVFHFCRIETHFYPFARELRGNVVFRVIDCDHGISPCMAFIAVIESVIEPAA